MYYVADIAGHSVYYSFHDEKTASFFGNEISFCENCRDEIVTVPDMKIRRYCKKCECGYAYSEYMNTLYMTSNYLLKYDICCFHSVAVQIGGRGYLISASSGVGKTTQYMNLKQLYGDSVEIINGDKPFLEFSEDRILIHPSLWRGKEDYGSDLVSELHGIIFLEQSDHNEIKPAVSENTVVMSLSKFLYYPDNEETVHRVCDLDRRLLRSVPLWLFKNTGDLSSSRMLYETVLSGGAEL